MVVRSCFEWMINGGRKVWWNGFPHKDVRKEGRKEHGRIAMDRRRGLNEDNQPDR